MGQRVNHMKPFLLMLLIGMLAGTGCRRVSKGDEQASGEGNVRSTDPADGDVDTSTDIGTDPRPLCPEKPCDENASCVDTGGTPICTCHDGFAGDGHTCADIDECANGTANCDSTNGVCTNTDGGYSCGCAAGWALGLDGITCLDKYVAVKVSAGWAHTCGVKTDGTALCWGNDGHGQLLGNPGQIRFKTIYEIREDAWSPI